MQTMRMLYLFITVIGADCVGKGFECIPTFRAIEIVEALRNNVN